MALRDSKINEIKNINLIYVFSVDSIFSDKNKKYIGIKIVYGDNSIIETDYTDPRFSQLVKRVIDRYNIEKDNRHIVLLGALTKEVMNNFSFDVLEEPEKNKQIPYFSVGNKKVNRYVPFIKETIMFIVERILKYNTFEINSINGYNYRYFIRYSIAGNREEAGMILYYKDDKLYFQINNINGIKSDISGTIEDELSLINIKFIVDKFVGNICIDNKNNIVEKDIKVGKELFYHDDTKQSISKKDMELINHYINMFNYNNQGNILKINDNLFLKYYEEQIEKTDQILFKNSRIIFSILKDELIITEIQKEGFSKYDGIINVELDKVVNETMMKKINVDGYDTVIVEINNNDNYNYEIISDKIDFKSMKKDIKREKISVKTMDDIKRYIRKRVK